MVLMQVKQSPSKLFFFCSEPAPEGGETSIVLSNVVVDKMEERQAEIMAKISESGMIFHIKTARDDGSGSGMVTDKTWKCTLRTDDEEEAKKRFAYLPSFITAKWYIWHLLLQQDYVFMCAYSQ